MSKAWNRLAMVVVAMALLGGAGTAVAQQDMDGDGFSPPADCDDYDPMIHPAAPELCDGLDNDCDGLVDEGCGNPCNDGIDNDGDGLVDEADECGGNPVDQDGDGFPQNQDCNDYDPTIHPGAPELCDGVDNDCDGLVDEGCNPDPCTDGLDNDGDGLIDEADECNTPVDNDGDGFIDAAAGGDDCNDNDPTVHPGAFEDCDGLDNNCDGLVDEGCGDDDSGDDDSGDDDTGNPADDDTGDDDTGDDDDTADDDSGDDDDTADDDSGDDDTWVEGPNCAIGEGYDGTRGAGALAVVALLLGAGLVRRRH